MKRGSRIGLALGLCLAVLLSSCSEDEPPAATSRVAVEATTETSVATTAATVGSEATTTSSTLPLVQDLLFVPEAFRDRLVDLVLETQALRGMTFSEPVGVEVITAQELARRLRSRVDEIPDLELNQALFKLLGLIAPEDDLAAILAAFGGRPAAGFYDAGSQTLWFVSNTEEVTPLEEMTLVGEIAKALVDRNLGVWRRNDRLASLGDSDSLTALRGMAEADSILVERLFLEGMDDQLRQEVIAAARAPVADQPVLPPFMHQSLRFSSEPAFDFLQRLYQLGGWDLINQTHQDPPETTEHVLTAGVGQLDAILMPKPGVAPPEGYGEVSDSVWGQWGWNALLSSALDPDQAAVASWGWGGDRYLILSNGVEVALVANYIGDTPEDTEEMRAALAEFVAAGMDAGRARVQNGGMEFYAEDYAWVSGEGEVVTFIVSSDVQAGREIRSSLVG